MIPCDWSSVRVGMRLPIVLSNVNAIQVMMDAVHEALAGHGIVEFLQHIIV